MFLVLPGRLAKYPSRSSVNPRNVRSLSERFSAVHSSHFFSSPRSRVIESSSRLNKDLAIMQLTERHIYPATEPSFSRYASRRSVVHSTGGMVACTQPLAAEAGQRILKMGGNAAV